MHAATFTQNFVTSCPYLGEPHGLRILAVDGLHYDLHGFQLKKVFQNYHLAKAFLNWDEREGVFLWNVLPEMLWTTRSLHEN